jgi:hypothetical protein
MRRISFVLLATALLGAATSDADDTASAKSTCIRTTQFQNWQASRDAKSIFIRADKKRVVRLELAKACPMLNAPFARLITKWSGSALACDALDWNLSVSQGSSPIPIPCVVQKVYAMTPEEVAALPKEQRP